MPQHATTDQEIQACFDVMSELRPHLERDTFVRTVKDMQKEGYRLLFESDGGTAVAAAGYRISSNLFMGKNLYVDDLVTAAHARSRGHGAALLEHIRDIARENDCAVLHLDSGTHRGRAHKFYFEQGMVIASYHFSERLTD